MAEERTIQDVYDTLTLAQKGPFNQLVNTVHAMGSSGTRDMYQSLDDDQRRLLMYMLEEAIRR